MSRTVPALLISAVLAAGCLPAPEKVAAEFNSALKPGATTAEIEAYFRSRDQSFTYNRVQNRYASMIRRQYRPFKSVLVHVYLDEQHCFVRAEAINVYTGL